MIFECSSSKGTKFTIDSETLEVEGKITIEGWWDLKEQIKKLESSKSILGGLRCIYYGWSEGEKRKKLKRFSQVVQNANIDGFEALIIVNSFKSKLNFEKLESQLIKIKKIGKNPQIFNSCLSLAKNSYISLEELAETIDENKGREDYFKSPETLALFHYAYKYNLLDVLLGCFTSFSHFKNACLNFCDNEFLSFNELEKVIDYVKYYQFLYSKPTTRIPKNILSEERKVRNQYHIFAEANENDAYEKIVQLFKNNFNIPKSKDFTIDFLDGITDLALEGQELNHCVFGYLRKVIEMETNIFSIKQKGKRVGTIQIKGREIVQYKGHSNSSLTDETMNYLKEVAKINNLTIN